MAKANPVEFRPQPPVDLPKGTPEIIYRGEGAEAIKFTPNPNARKIVVNASGTILEYL